MKDAVDTVEEALRAVDKLRRTLASGTSSQVSANSEKALAKATALAWLRNQRPALPDEIPGLIDANQMYQDLLEYSDRNITRNRYKSHLKQMRKCLLRIRAEAIQRPPEPRTADAFGVTPPDFSPLVSDPAMRTILANRWNETAICLKYGANLAATVMMGGLLEALLLARLNHMSDKSLAFKAASAPVDKKTGKVAELKHWGLNDFIEVAHELKWIRQSARDVGHVLRDYRNYVHPAKELSHGGTISAEDASMFWVLFQSLTQQVLRVP